MAKFYQVLRLEKSKDRVRHWLKDAGEDSFRDYFDVRAAVVWPGFYCILGEEAYDEHYFDQSAPGILRLLDEYQEPTLSVTDFLDRLTDATLLYGASVCYGETADRFNAYVDSFWGYLDKRRLRLDLLEPPYSDNFALLMSKVQDAVNNGLLRVEKTSETSQELQSLSTADFQDATDKFPKLRALGFAVAGFEKYGSRRALLNLGRAGQGMSKGWML